MIKTPDIDRGKVTLFLKWIEERLDIHYKRFCEGTPPPWTDDEVLREYRFVNPVRRLDRGTILYLHHTKQHELSKDVNGLFLYTFLYRINNARWFFDVLPSPITLNDFERLFNDILQRYEQHKGKYRLTYNIPLPAGLKTGDRFKLWLDWAKSHLHVFNITKNAIHIVGDPIAMMSYIRQTTGLPYHIAYQITLDMSYSPLTSFPDNFTIVTPLTVGGINILINKEQETHTSTYGAKFVKSMTEFDRITYLSLIEEVWVITKESLRATRFSDKVTKCLKVAGIPIEEYSELLLQDTEHSLGGFRAWYAHKEGIQLNRRKFSVETED